MMFKSLLKNLTRKLIDLCYYTDEEIEELIRIAQRKSGKKYLPSYTDKEIDNLIKNTQND